MTVDRGRSVHRGHDHHRQGSARSRLLRQEAVPVEAITTYAGVGSEATVAIFEPESAGRWRQHVDRAVQTGQGQAYDLLLDRPDGVKVHVQASAVVRTDQRGHVVAPAGTIQYVTARDLAERLDLRTMWRVVPRGTTSACGTRSRCRVGLPHLPGARGRRRPREGRRGVRAGDVRRRRLARGGSRQPARGDRRVLEDAIISQDRSGVVTSWNPGAAPRVPGRGAGRSAPLALSGDHGTAAATGTCSQRDPDSASAELTPS